MKRRRFFGLLAAAPAAVSTPVSDVAAADQWNAILGSAPLKLTAADERTFEVRTFKTIWHDIADKYGVQLQAEPVGRPFTMYSADARVYVDDRNVEILRIPLRTWEKSTPLDSSEGVSAAPSLPASAPPDRGRP